MKIDTVIVGSLETNSYILCLNNKCLIIDPGDEAQKILDATCNQEIVGIIITHYHFDHIGALDEIRTKTNAKVYDYTNLKSGINTIDDFNFTVYFTPGHKEDSISLLFDSKYLFCGDFIFNGGIGRCDLVGGDFTTMKKSIKNILSLSDDIVIYPGHGAITTIKNEREKLSYLAQ